MVLAIKLCMTTRAHKMSHIKTPIVAIIAYVSRILGDRHIFTELGCSTSDLFEEVLCNNGDCVLMAYMIAAFGSFQTIETDRMYLKAPHMQQKVRIFDTAQGYGYMKSDVVICHSPTVDQFFTDIQQLIRPKAVVLFLDWNIDDVRTTVDAHLKSLHGTLRILHCTNIRTSWDGVVDPAGNRFANGIGLFYIQLDYTAHQKACIYRNKFGTNMLIEQIRFRLRMRDKWFGQNSEGCEDNVGLVSFWIELMLPHKLAHVNPNIVQVGMDRGDHVLVWTGLVPGCKTITLDRTFKQLILCGSV